MLDILPYPSCPILRQPCETHDVLYKLTIGIDVPSLSFSSGMGVCMFAMIIVETLKQRRDVWIIVVAKYLTEYLEVRGMENRCWEIVKAMCIFKIMYDEWRKKGSRMRSRR